MRAFIQTVVSGHIDIACNFSDTTVCLTARTVPAVNQTDASYRGEMRTVFADRKNIHAALLRFLAYFLTIQFDENITRYAVVRPLRKAASNEPRIAILGIWGDTWLTRGKYGIYVAVRGSYEALTG